MSSQAHRARDITDEQWHPEQRGTWLEDGSYELVIPYLESRELVMDVMRHGADVVVMAPAELGEEIGRELRRAAARYSRLQ